MNTPSANIITMEAHSGYSAVFKLLTALKDQRNSPVTVDASKVKHIGAPCLEVLMSAARSWKNDGVGFQIINHSDAYSEGVSRMEIPSSQLGGMESAHAN